MYLTLLSIIFAFAAKKMKTEFRNSGNPVLVYTSSLTVLHRVACERNTNERGSVSKLHINPKETEIRVS